MNNQIPSDTNGNEDTSTAKLIKSGSLFRRRLLQHWKFQYGVWRIAIDWTVMLYLLIPGLLIGGYFYKSWWQEMPSWSEPVPFILLIGIVFLLCWTSSLRLFIEAPDQLFLRQQASWIQTLIRRGLMYSTIWHLFFGAVLVMLFAPFLVNRYGLTTQQLILFMALTMLLKTTLAFARNLVNGRLVGWLRWVTMVALFFLVGLGFRYTVVYILPNTTWGLAVIMAALVVVWVLLFRERLARHGRFLEDVRQEELQQMKVVVLLLGNYVDKKIKTRRTRPWIFRTSQQIFKERNSVHGLTELCVKSFIRSNQQLRLYVQFTGLCIVAVLMVPVTIKWIIWIILAFPFAYWLSLYWKKTASASYLRMFHWREPDLAEASRKSVLLLMLPGYLLVGLVVGILSGTWMTGIVALGLGIAIAFMATSLISLIRSFQEIRS